MCNRIIFVHYCILLVYSALLSKIVYIFPSFLSIEISVAAGMMYVVYIINNHANPRPTRDSDFLRSRMHYSSDT